MRFRRWLPLLLLALSAATPAIQGVRASPEISPSTTAAASRPRFYCRDRTEAISERSGARWRAVGCFWLDAKGAEGHTGVEIDRWDGRSWSRQATVSIPLGGPWNFLRRATLTRGETPDFIASAGGGADWLPLAVVARLRGRWQLVPFDSPALLGTHLVVQSQAPVRFGMVHSTVDACGCAAGPITSIWYRFDGRRFVPAEPPGRAPGCTVSRLAHARVLPGAPSYLGSPGARFAPFHPSQLACLDGWALAKSVGGVYALFNLQVARWQRATVGRWHAVREIAKYFALPDDLLNRLDAGLWP